jgi:NAD(P)-dependent dehydrogenase (short-subunit alcohol dehydrogenase family)
MKEDIFNLKEKVIIVTGGLGQLGRQFTLALLERGARVAVFDVRTSPGLVAERYGDSCGNPSLQFHEVDITDRSSIENALQKVISSWGVPHGLINNAALDSPPHADASENGPFESYPEASWDKVMEVNVKGLFLCCQVMGGEMAKAGRGSIINIASIYGLVSPDQRIYEYRNTGGAQFYKPVAYSVSKSSLYNLTRYLATYWAKKNVRVNTLTLAGVFNNQDERFLEGYCARMPVGRMAREDEYNGAIIFLLSAASSYMTGSNMVVDGGWTAW